MSDSPRPLDEETELTIARVAWAYHRNVLAAPNGEYEASAETLRSRIRTLVDQKLEQTFAVIRNALNESDRTITIDEEENGDICIRVFKTPQPEKP